MYLWDSKGETDDDYMIHKDGKGLLSFYNFIFEHQIKKIINPTTHAQMKPH